jgi:hypothetical protein
MARKTCTITSREKATSDKATVNALDGALRSGAGAILNRLARRSHEVASAWTAAGRRSGADEPSQGDGN